MLTRPAYTRQFPPILAAVSTDDQFYVEVKFGANLPKNGEGARDVRCSQATLRTELRCTSILYLSSAHS